VSDPLAAVLIDGYVWLDEAGSPGLGAHLYRALEERVAVIGVAKSRYRHPVAAREVLRGGSQRPLYVSAVGVDLEEAAAWVAHMHGEYRIPTLLKRVDQLCRGRA
jgi:deoxyribonuclease V